VLHSPAGCILRLVGKRVAASDIGRNDPKRVPNQVSRFWLERQASGHLRETTQGASVVTERDRVDQGDRVDHHIRRLNFLDQIVVRHPACVISTIAQHDHDAPFVSPLPDAVHRFRQCVVKRGLSQHGEVVRQRVSQLHRIAGEVSAGIQHARDTLVEHQRKELVVGIAGLGQCGDAGNHAVAIDQHAAAGIDQQTDGRWRILFGEEGDLLRTALFKDLERLGWQAADEAAAIVGDRHVEEHELGPRGEARIILCGDVDSATATAAPNAINAVNVSIVARMVPPN
jgi:hypothetical protein